jgi:hypothetical protein
MTTETKFVVGKWYKRGDGELIRVVCVDAPGSFPVVGIKSCGNPVTFTSDGYFWEDDVDSDKDLIPTPIEPKKKGVVWVNVYSDRECLGVSYSTRDKADRTASPDRIARIRVEWEEGRFDE